MTPPKTPGKSQDMDKSLDSLEREAPQISAETLIRESTSKLDFASQRLVERIKDTDEAALRRAIDSLGK